MENSSHQIRNWYLSIFHTQNSIIELSLSRCCFVDVKFNKFSSFRIERRFLKRSQVFERKIVTHNNARDQNEVYLCVCLSIAYILRRRTSLSMCSSWFWSKWSKDEFDGCCHRYRHLEQIVCALAKDEIWRVKQTLSSSTSIEIEIMRDCSRHTIADNVISLIHFVLCWAFFISLMNYERKEVAGAMAKFHLQLRTKWIITLMTMLSGW